MTEDQTIISIVLFLMAVVAFILLHILVKVFKGPKVLGRTPIVCPGCGYMSLGGSSLNGHEPAEHICPGDNKRR